MANDPVLPVELKKCPFCGEFAEVRASNLSARVWCPNESCAVQPQTSQYNSISAAIGYWNDRPEVTDGK